MPESKLDFLIINGGGADFSARSLFESYCESNEQFERLPTKLKTDKETIMLNLFRELHSSKSSNALFRKSDSVNSALVTYWLSKVRQLAMASVLLNNIPSFNGITKDELSEIASLNNDVKILPSLIELLALKGIVLIIEPSIDGLKTDGAVCKLDTGHPVIALSLRYSRLDNFWFTLMHELSHIHLHFEKLDGCLIDNFDVIRDDPIELEANKLAANLLIPRNIWRSCPARKCFDEKSVDAFSKKHNIHPIIIAGRLQKELNLYNKLRKVVDAINVRDIFKNE